MDGGERREPGTKAKIGGEGRRDWNGGWAFGSLSVEGGLYLDICASS